MPDPLDGLDQDSRDKIRKRDHPEWMSPMLATLTHDPFSDEKWIYERKLDGVRTIVHRQGEEVRLLSRNKNRVNSSYPEIVESFEKTKADDFIIDGEIVCFEQGKTSFSRLQERMHVEEPDKALLQRIAVYFYAFDLMYLDGHDVTKLPLRDRKGLLRNTLDFEDPLRFTTHRNGKGEEFLEEACRKGWEGLIAKRADSPYRHSRSRDWLKFKCVRRQELVVGGFTEPQGSRIGFGALLVGFYDGDDLRYAGKVGTGYDDETLRKLSDRLERIERKTCPFAAPDAIKEKSAHWVTPKLVAEVGFTEWTGDHKLRHPRFLGLRKDKKPEKVVKEDPVARGEG